MADVFISYEHIDRPKARLLAEALKHQQVSVWWDRNILPGDMWREVIDRELDSASVVIVLWSSHSVKSLWVQSEAEEGARRGALVPALIESDLRLPLIFRSFQTADLTDWNGGIEELERTGLPQSVTKILQTAEAKRKAEEERQAREAAEAERRVEEERQAKEAADAKRKADQEERKALEVAEAERRAEEERKAQAAAADANRKADEERKAREAAEAKRKADKERKAQAAAEALRVKVQQDEEDESERQQAEKAQEMSEGASKSRSSKDAEIKGRSQKKWRPSLGNTAKIGIVFGMLFLAGGIFQSFQVYQSKVARSNKEALARAISLMEAEEKAAQAKLKADEERKAQAAAAETRWSYEPEMVRISGGCFEMGSPNGEKGHEDDEQQHEVCVDSFLMAKYEVTVAEYRRFRKASPETKSSSGCFVWIKGIWQLEATLDWRNPGFSQSEDDPVACVSWDDAVAYIGWLNGESGQDYRLPTEAEWEYAARGREPGARFWGDDLSVACRFANVADQAAWRKVGWSNVDIFPCDDGFAYTAPVRSSAFKPNAYGLYHMLGNVWEWTCSKYVATYDGSSERRCDESSDRRVLRGGSWYVSPDFVRSAGRSWLGPGNRDNAIGFRLARSL